MAYKRARFVLSARTYEPNGPGKMDYPIVEHRFYGQTQQEAEGYFKAHLRNDKFLDACYRKRLFKDFECITVVSISRA